MQPFVTSFINRKGGCGKSSATFHLGGTFARQGKRVLLIDTDPQASLTQGLLGPVAVEEMLPDCTIVGLFGDTESQAIVLPTGIDNLSILPGSNGLEELNNPRPHNTGEWQLALRSWVQEAKNGFDLVLIDCPPTLGLCSWNAILASDYVVVPLQPEDYGSQGIVHIQRFIDRALMKYNPTLKLLGYLLTMVQSNLAIHQAYRTRLQELYQGDVFAAVMPLAKDFKEAIADRKPISHYKPKSAAGKAVGLIAAEMLLRAERLATLPARFLCQSGIGA